MAVNPRRQMDPLPQAVGSSDFGNGSGGPGPSHSRIGGGHAHAALSLCIWPAGPHVAMLEVRLIGLRELDDLTLAASAEAVGQLESRASFGDENYVFQLTPRLTAYLDTRTAKLSSNSSIAGVRHLATLATGATPGQNSPQAAFVDAHGQRCPGRTGVGCKTDAASPPAACVSTGISDIRPAKARM
jgi:hypothetical protein